MMKNIGLWAILMLAASPAWAVNIQEVIAPKTGVKAWLVEDRQLPIVAMHLAFEGGSEQDPAEKQGLATLTMNAMTEAAGSYDLESFQKELADHSITLNFSAQRDQIEGNVKSLRADKDRAFDLLRLALSQPRFEGPDIERLRAQQLAAMRHQFADPDWQARYALLSHVFAGHPYSQRHLGTEKGLQTITRDDIVAFSRNHLARDNVSVAVAGDMTPEELATALDVIFADVPEHADLAVIPDVDPAKDAPVIGVSRRGTQTDIMFSMPGPKRDDEGWYAAELANYILGGGGFSSRLMQDVRDAKGLTYGVDTGLAPSEHAGLIVGQAAVDNPKVAEAIETMRDTMRRFRSEGPTDQEVKAARDYLTGSMPLALTSTDKIASVLVTMQREHLGRDYLDRYSEIMGSVTMDDVKQSIDKWFNPNKTTWVLVGEPDNVTPDLKQEVVRQ